MRIIILSILLVVSLSGCATTEYFTNPNSAGYNEAGLGGLCQNCNRQFNFSGYQLDNQENVSCCYCGYVQNLRMAANRYTYEVQQQQAINTQQAIANFNQSMKEINEKRAADEQRRIENFQKNINQPGSWSNPIRVKVAE